MNKIKYTVSKILIIVFFLFINIFNMVFAIDIKPINLDLPSDTKKLNDLIKKDTKPPKYEQPDFADLYMKELQKRIKMNWDPPKENESKKVVLLFKIDKDGKLLAAKVFKTSGNDKADKAALKAVEVTAPFKPLPYEFKGKSIDIQFTFDYNVWQSKVNPDNIAPAYSVPFYATPL